MIILQLALAGISESMGASNRKSHFNNCVMKKKIYSFIMMAVLACMACTSRAAAYQGSRVFWDLSSRRTVFGSGGYARIIQLHDGRLMATCESGGIVVAFSSDMGDTWGAPVRIAGNANKVPNCVPDLIQLADGTIVVAYNPRPSKPYTTDRKFGIRCKRSTDNGQTWSDEIFVNDASYTFEDGCWEPSMLQLPSGELQLYFADEGPYTSSSEQQISLCRSFDGGLTWSAPQKVSFRAGYRDGMPSPVLLADKSSIVVAIEDNGWPGYGDFFPTTVRCALADNWPDGFFVDANNPLRQKTHTNTSAKGGAPYLRVLPWGETVLSWQSKYKHGDKLNMLTAVGDGKATNFKALSNPFCIGDDEQALWNSLAVVDTGVVVAVAGISGKVEMIKGYAMRQFEAAQATPVVDGTVSAGDGYMRRSANQVMMGAANNLRTTADFAYDAGNLYFVAKVVDTTPSLSATGGDGVWLYVETADEPGARLGDGSYRFFLSRDGSVKAWRGNNGGWKSYAVEGVGLKVVSRASSYVVEAAVPWSVLGKDAAPSGRHLATNIEVQDVRESAKLTESIPDARATSPSTWMDFYLRPSGQSTGVGSVAGTGGLTVAADSGWLTLTADRPMSRVDVLSVSGRLIAHVEPASCQSRLAVGAASGVAVVEVCFADGTKTVRKLVVR